MADESTTATPEPTGGPAAGGAAAAAKPPVPAKPAAPPAQRQSLKKDADTSIPSFPALVYREFIAALVVGVFLTVIALLVQSPLQQQADPSLTPDPSKAPWYFLGLQELLSYFHPTVAGVLVPTFVLVGAALIPFVDRGNLTATRPSQRKTAVVLFSMFCALGLIVTFVGIFFRGPGYAFVIPYLNTDGLHFSL